MADVEVLTLEKPRRFHLEWLLQVIWKPRKVLAQVVEENKANWMIPLLILTLLAVGLVWAGAPIRQAMAQALPVEPPPDFQWWSPEQQAQFQEAMAARSGPMFTYILPGLGELLKVWLSWLVLSALLHLLLTLFGSRTSSGTIQNLVAWASVPLMIRYIVQIIYMVSTHRLISAPGVSGFAPVGEGIWPVFLAAILAGIDFYLIWQIVLLLIGLRPMAGITLFKAILAVTLSVLIVLALGALPSVAGQLMGGLEISRPFMF